jgi:hypothetical protein
MRSHPRRVVYGPEKLRDLSNFVATLFTVYGPAPWDFASEVGPQSACGRCGGRIDHPRLACGGCHRVARENQRKFDRERSPLWDPKPASKAKPKPKVAVAAVEQSVAKVAVKRVKKTARDRRRLLQAAHRFQSAPAVRAWVAEHELVA